MRLAVPEQDTLHITPSHKAALQNDSVHADTVLYCYRNSITDVTFTSGNQFFKDLQVPSSNNAIIEIASRTGIRKAEERQMLVRHLREGESISSSETRDDWFIFIILAAGVLLTIIRATSKNFNPFMRFFLLRGVNDPESRDTGGLFFWQTTLFNILSFLIMSMFIYKAASHYDLIPPGTGNAVFWLLSLVAVMLSLTLRHIACLITGNLSEKRDVFDEYLVCVYQFYQYSAVLLLIPVVLVTYTSVLPPEALIAGGLAILGLMYLLRIGRLLVIFINRNISIFYLILYLCALEILPVSVLIRYFSGHA